MNKRSKFVRLISVIMAVIMLVGLIAGILASTLHVHAATSSEIQQRIEELEAQSAAIDQQQIDLQSEIAETDQMEADMMEQKAAIEQQMTLTRQQIDTTKGKIEQYELLIAEKESELEEARDHEDALYEQYSDRIRAMEENGSVTYWSILFKASSFSDLLDRLDMIQEIARSDQAMMVSLQAASDEILAAQDSLEDTKKDLETEQSTLESQETELDTQREAVQALIDQYSEEGVLLQDLYDQYESRQEVLLLELAENQEAYAMLVAAEEAARKAEEEQKRQEEEQKRQEEEQKKEENKKDEQEPEQEPEEDRDLTGSVGAVEPEQPAPETNKPTSTISFISPLSSYVLTSPFGNRIHPIYGTERFHYGVDMSAPEGTPIYAAAAGTVTVTSYDSSSGNYVSIAHSGGFSTSYLHMTHYIVSPGQYVAQGQVIGYVGSTGLSTGPHLHFAMIKDGSYVNPMDYL